MLTIHPTLRAEMPFHGNDHASKTRRDIFRQFGTQFLIAIAQRIGVRDEVSFTPNHSRLAPQAVLQHENFRVTIAESVQFTGLELRYGAVSNRDAVAELEHGVRLTKWNADEYEELIAHCQSIVAAATARAAQ